MSHNDGQPQRNDPSRLRETDMRSLTPEEVKMYKDCVRGVFFKYSLPYAAVFHLVSSYMHTFRRDAKQIPFKHFSPKNTFLFLANAMLGTIIFSPVCAQGILERREKSEQKRPAEVSEIPAVQRKTQPTSLPDDYNYPTDLTSSFNEAENTFATELSTSVIQQSEEEPIKILPKTTYEDLRRQHRSSFDRNYKEPPKSQTSRFYSSVPDEKPLDETPPPSEEGPRKFVKRNKYGDEIE